jgi:hypothetical protein
MMMTEYVDHNGLRMDHSLAEHIQPEAVRGTPIDATRF